MGKARKGETKVEPGGDQHKMHALKSWAFTRRESLIWF